ncbi:MAG: sialidase family protein [Phycisphaerae bacterium]|nr:sialidase family protein [Phycisphaerae bacterium]
MMKAHCAALFVMLFASTVATAQPDPGFRTLLIIEPTKEHPRHSEGDVIELKDGRLCLVYSRFSGASDDHAAAEIVMRTSADAGKTWSDDRVLVSGEGRMNVMSVSLLRLPSGEILLFYLRKNALDDMPMMVRRSHDELQTLSEPVRVTVDDGYHVVNNARVVRLSTGRLVVPAALHPSSDRDEKSFSPRGVMRAFLSDDDGRTWRGDKSGQGVQPDPSVTLQEPGVVELKDGRLLMWIRTDRGTQYESISDDKGEHWSKPVPGKLASPLSPATIERNPWTGDLVCVWNDHSGRHVFPAGKRTPLCLAVSRDEGKTWQPSRVIEGDPNGWYCYTSMSFIKDRLILSYCAGDSKVGGLNRLKVVAFSRAWLDIQ